MHKITYGIVPLLLINVLWLPARWAWDRDEKLSLQWGWVVWCLVKNSSVSVLGNCYQPLALNTALSSFVSFKLYSSLQSFSVWRETSHGGFWTDLWYNLCWWTIRSLCLLSRDGLFLWPQIWMQRLVTENVWKMLKPLITCGASTKYGNEKYPLVTESNL